MDRSEPDPRVHEAEEHDLCVVNEYRCHHRQPILDRLSSLFEEVDLTLLTTVPELDHFPDRLGAKYYATWVPDSKGATPTWPPGIGKRLFVYLKPYPELPYLLNRLSVLGCPTVAYIADCPQALLNVSCRTIRIVANPVAVGHVAQHCDAVILHGGHGSTLQFLLEGKPLFQLPLVLEQRLTAMRVANLGVGLCANPHNKDAVRRGLDAFLKTSSYALRAREFANRYDATDSSAQLELAMRELVRLL